jgi:hypothetical protein
LQLEGQLVRSAGDCHKSNQQLASAILACLRGNNPKKPTMGIERRGTPMGLIFADLNDSAQVSKVDSKNSQKPRLLVLLRRVRQKGNRQERQGKQAFFVSEHRMGLGGPTSVWKCCIHLQKDKVVHACFSSQIRSNLSWRSWRPWRFNPALSY